MNKKAIFYNLPKLLLHVPVCRRCCMLDCTLSSLFDFINHIGTLEAWVHIENKLCEIYVSIFLSGQKSWIEFRKYKWVTQQVMIRITKAQNIKLITQNLKRLPCSAIFLKPLSEILQDTKVFLLSTLRD